MSQFQIAGQLANSQAASNLTQPIVIAILIGGVVIGGYFLITALPNALAGAGTELIGSAGRTAEGLLGTGGKTAESLLTAASNAPGNLIAGVGKGFEDAIGSGIDAAENIWDSSIGKLIP